MEGKELTLQEKIDRAKPGDIIWHVVGTPNPLVLRERPTVTKEWVGDLGDLFFDLEHSCDEPVDRSTGRKSYAEAWGEIVEMLAGAGVKVTDE